MIFFITGDASWSIVDIHVLNSLANERTIWFDDHNMLARFLLKTLV